jgi:hypothetical protein
MTIMVTRTRLCYVKYVLPVFSDDGFHVKLHSICMRLLLNYLLVRVSLFDFFYCACGGGNVARMDLLEHPRGHT